MQEVGFIYGTLPAATNSYFVALASAGPDDQNGVASALTLGALVGFPLIYISAAVYEFDSPVALFTISEDIKEAMTILSTFGSG